MPVNTSSHFDFGEPLYWIFPLMLMLGELILPYALVSTAGKWLLARLFRFDRARRRMVLRVNLVTQMLFPLVGFSLGVLVSELLHGEQFAAVYSVLGLLTAVLEYRFLTKRYAAYPRKRLLVWVILANGCSLALWQWRWSVRLTGWL